ncbi:hypothetical protein A2V82_04395 [candidate division KSB1 bacterium RBG_16_48_16]|nr:MAG: hypothetical protein A2V82_04395 [candidate division KSB1 bacterium RBG_16_48_16]
MDYINGKVKGKAVGNLPYRESFNIRFQYYPVFQSAYIEKSPYASETLDTDIFDGVSLSFNNAWKVEIDTLKSLWSNPQKAYNFTFKIIDTNFGAERLLGLSHPSDYRIEFADGVVDTSLAIEKYFVRAVPVSFRIYNVTDQKYLDFIYNDIDRNRKLSPFDEIILVEKGASGQDLFTWDIFFTSLQDTVYDYTSSDTLAIRVKKPFRAVDVFEFATQLPQVNKQRATAELEDIKVVPNPYIAATSHELPLPPAITSGRGDRKIDFIHLPADAQVHIFTSRGEHVVTLSQDSGMYDGTVSWNLKSKENLDVAAGIYFYIVESDVGVKRGKIGVIK